MGMVVKLYIMRAAVILAVLIMLIVVNPISNLVEKFPTIKMLALSFLLLVGVVLVGDGLGHHVEKGYIYFAIAFSFGVVMLNLRAKGKAKPVELRTPY